MEPSMESHEGSRTGVSTHIVDAVVAILVTILGGVVIYGSRKLGSEWTSDGPGAGYFPFYIGVFICIASLITLGQVLFGKTRDEHKVFVEWEQLKLVLSVLVPAAVFVLGIQLIGIYVAATAYIAVFMIWLGKYGWIKSLVLGLAVSTTTFLMFEVWFQVPLFKGAFNPLTFTGY